MIVSHNLDIRLGIDFSPLLNSNNLNGASIALGAKNDSDVIINFSNNIVNAIEKSFNGFVNVKLVSATIKNSNNSIDLEKVTDANKSIDLLNQIEEHLFSIKADMGELDSIIVNSELLNKEINKKLNIPYDKVIFRPDLKNNYVIRFIDCQSQIKEIGG